MDKASSELKKTWQEFSLFEQMGNIGSEVWRALSFKEQGEQELARQCAERAFQLIDLTVSDARWQDKLGEIALLKKVLRDYFLELGHFKVSPDALKDYFIPFALKARKKCST